MKLISIITVVYNDANHIGDTVLSVLSQKYQDVDYVVIDGGSTDKTLSILEQYRDNISCLISESDNGIYDAMNKGVANAQGVWVCFMNSGDTFYDANTLLNVAPLLNSHYDVVYGDTNCLYDIGNYIVKSKEPQYLKRNMPFCHQSSFTKRSLLLEHPFDLSFKYVADYNFFYNCYLNSFRFKRIDIVIANFDAVEGISSRNKVEVFDELLRVQKGKNSLKERICLRLILVKFLFMEKLKHIFPICINQMRKYSLSKKYFL